MNLATALEVTIKWKDASRAFVASCQFGILNGMGETRALALKNFEKKCQDVEKAGGGLIEVHFGVGNSDLFLIQSGTTAEQLLLDTDISEKLGFNPFNVRAVRDGHPLNAEDLIKPHSKIHIETNVSMKRFSLPKEHKVRRWLKKIKAKFEGYGKGDHENWRINGERVQLNYRNGELDLASIKAIAKALRKSLFEILQAI